MATYCFYCPSCGETTISPQREIFGDCTLCGLSKYIRDYRAEGVGINVGDLKKTREHPIEEYAAKFLPSNKDFASSSDPEGKKGMREWRDRHTPDSSNKRPYWPGDV